MLERIRACCYKILPLVYDQSLSYYETLCKVVSKLNEVIDYVNTTVTNEIKQAIGKLVIDAVYDSESETLTIYINSEE